MPPRLAPLLAEYDFASNRLLQRLSGPTVDSGDDLQVEVEPLTDAELLWEPVPGAWTLRRQSEGPGGLGATRLVGSGEWGHDGGRPHPWPPPVTSIGWRINRVAKTLAGRADHTDGTHTHTEAGDEPQGTAAGALARGWPRRSRRGARRSWGPTTPPSTRSATAPTRTGRTPRRRSSTSSGG